MTASVTPRRPRILYVVSLFPCWSETFIARELATLVALGADVRILSLKAPSEALVQPAAAALLPLARHPLPLAAALAARARALATAPGAFATLAARLAVRLAGRPVELAKSLEALARGAEQLAWARAFDPDVIHAHWGTYPSTVAWALARALGKPFGFTTHAHDIFVHDHLLAEKLAAAAVPVTISRFNVDWLAAHATPLARERLAVIHCGVDLETLPFRAGGRQPGTLLSIGRLDGIKGFEVLVDALALLVREGRHVQCRVVGAGPREQDLRSRAARLGLGGAFELVGAWPEPEVRAALAEASVFVLPSVVTPRGDRDGIPVSLMEAMAAGTPVVSTRVSGIPELIEHEREGLLVPERDAPALAAALARLLDDPGLAARLAAAARAKIEREFDAAREGRKLLDLFVERAGAARPTTGVG